MSPGPPREDKGRLLPGLFWRAIKRRRVDTFVLALDLSVPPLSLLLLLQGVALVTAVLAAIAGASTVPAYVLGVSAAMLIAAVFLAWVSFGRDRIPAASLKGAPFYILRKIPLYASFFTNRQANWTVDSPPPTSKSSNTF